MMTRRDEAAQAHLRKRLRPVGAYVIRLLVGLLLISPLLVGLVFSFVPNDILGTVPSLSRVLQNLTLENYQWVLTNIPIGRFLFNSLLVCGIIIISQAVLSCMSGYVFAFFAFPGKKLLFNLVLVAMMIPAEVTVITNFLHVQGWGMVNTHIGLAITSLVGGTSIFMMRQFFLQIPREIKEASVVDGCGNLRFLIKIAVPMAVPAISSLAITQFIGAFNMYFWPMLIAQKKEMQTVQIGMSMLVGAENKEYGYIMAGAILCIVIPVIAFIIGEDRIIKGMTEGAVKG